MKSVTAAILVKENKILIAKRNTTDRLAGKWEFPGGTIEDGETPEQCLKREMKEEFDIEVMVGDYFSESIYSYSHGQIRLLAYKTYWTAGEMQPKVHDDYQWIDINQLNSYDLAPADIPIAKEVMNYDW